MAQGDALNSLDLIFEWNEASKDDWLFWRGHIKNSSPQIKSVLLEFFASFPGEIRHFTEKARNKEKALKDKNDNEWQSIIDEEKIYFQTLISK